MAQQNLMQESQKNSKYKRVAALDGFKGMMILAIIGYYYFQNYLPGGFFAVNAFFAVGGYLAFRDNKHLFHKKPVEWHFSSKLSRLWLPMLFMIIGTVAFLFIALPEQLKNIRMMSLSSLVFFNNYYQIINQQSYFVQSINPSPFVHLWYVSLYFQLMLIAVGIRKIFNRLNLLRMQESLVLLILSILSAIFMTVMYVIQKDPSYIYYAISTRIFSFLLGGVLSYFTEGQLSLSLPKSKSSSLFTQLIGVVALLLMGWMILSFNGVQDETYLYGMQLFSIVSIVFLWSILHENSVLNYFLRFRGFTFFGRRSFSYYLWFYPVHMFAPYFQNGEESNVVFLGIQMLCIILLSEITYKIFETKQWLVPLGQSFSFMSIHHFVMRELPPVKKMMGMAFSFTYIILIGLAFVGFFQSTTETNLVAQQLENVIKRNQELIEQTTQEESTTVDPNKEIQLKEQIAQEPVTFVGDSILLAAADKIQEIFPKAIIDGKIGRQLYSSPATLQELISKDKMANRVVTLLGTNGTFSQKQLDEYIRTLGDRELYFVTIFAPVKWNNEVNQQLQEAKTRHANVHIIDWYEFAKNHAEWFYEDKIHPNTQGAEELAQYSLESITQIKMNE
ncbi:acyltransferase family protein [Granulicatella elegans]|uniref:acyltransferase family protein n=1 Tax=Granulicatella elegans TaxID=137732 RepID=UPI0028D24A97|nr:acyltransferase family protein [Granulicatella elegans]